MKNKYTFALIGNPNCGKTTLFNLLTGSDYTVGNFPGVTVEHKEGFLQTNPKIRIVDLPGIYSLSPNSTEEIITRRYIEQHSFDLIINIIDLTAPERSLYLTSQLADCSLNVVCALNMADTFEKNGSKIDISLFEKMLGFSCVKISAAKETGIEELINTAVQASALNCPHVHKITSDTSEEDISRRYAKIRKICRTCIKTANTDRNNTEKIDSVICHPILAIPIFLLIMLLIFCITFGSFGKMLSDGLSYILNVPFINLVTSLLHNAPPFISSLITDGIIPGIGAVVTFFPQVMLLFFFLAILEDSGYMARCAFIMDKLFSSFGLSGKAVVPMIIGFGCSVPAFMSVRTLENERSRRLTLMLLPFISCGAKMPVYSLIAAAFFPHQTVLVIFSLYLLGMALGVISAIIFSKIVFKDGDTPFILELPPYRMPTVKSVLTHMSCHLRDFAAKVGTVLLSASIIIWLLQNMDITLVPVTQSHNSILGAIGSAAAVLFIPCGFGSWQITVSLICGLAAKEAIISSMAITYGTAELTSYLPQIMTPLQGYSLLVFILLYTPCAAAMSALKNELHSIRLTLFCALYQFGTAWLISALVYQLGRFIL